MVRLSFTFKRDTLTNELLETFGFGRNVVFADREQWCGIVAGGIGGNSFDDIRGGVRERDGDAGNACAGGIGNCSGDGARDTLREGGQTGEE